MIINVNKENFDLLAATACPVDFQVNCIDSYRAQSGGYCMLQDNEVYYGLYNGSCIVTCRACWLKWLSKESEDNHE